MDEIIYIVKEEPQRGFIAGALGESIFTEADDLDSLRAVKQCCAISGKNCVSLGCSLPNNSP